MKGKNRKNRVDGSGVNPFDIAHRISLKFNPNQVKFPDELHGIKLEKNAITGSKEHVGDIYNFLGAKTHIKERMLLGDMSKPLDSLDLLAKKHDIAYMNAKGDAKKIRDADYDFVEATKHVKDVPKTAKLARVIINGKEVGETLGLLDRNTFSGNGIASNAASLRGGSDVIKLRDPLERLRIAVKNSKNGHVTGGALPAFVIPLIVSAGTKLVELIFNKLFPPKKQLSGSGSNRGSTRIREDDKKTLIMSKLEHDPKQYELIKDLLNV